jgi:hypothetical protein
MNPRIPDTLTVSSNTPANEQKAVTTTAFTFN